MNRTTSLDRRYRRILVGGLVGSVVLHVALVALLRFDIPILSRPDSAVALLSPVPEPVREEAEDVTEVIRVAGESAPAEAAGDAGAAALPPQGDAAAAELSIAVSTAAAPVVEVSAEPAFERLAVVDPLSRAAVRPIAFDALPEAVTTAPSGDEEDGVELYVPGSVGRAKRQWAKGMGEAEAGSGSGIRLGVIGLGGGGHCPMPGRVPVSW